MIKLFSVVLQIKSGGLLRVADMVRPRGRELPWRGWAGLGKEPALQTSERERSFCKGPEAWEPARVKSQKTFLGKALRLCSYDSGLWRSLSRAMGPSEQVFRPITLTVM